MNPWQPSNHRVRQAIRQISSAARHNAKRRRKLAGCPAVDFVYALLACQCRRVNSCLGVPFNVDHVLPLDAGGKHVAGNLQVLPARLNLAKANKPDFVLPEPYRNPSPQK